MSILLSALFIQAVASAPAIATNPAPKQPHKICRDMLVSSSRLGTVRVCRTRAAWEKWRRCHSATRYCDPPKQQTVTVASLPDDKLICKFLKTTGSRLQQEKICATTRQWELTELETQETMRDRQNQSRLPPGGQ